MSHGALVMQSSKEFAVQVRALLPLRTDDAERKGAVIRHDLLLVKAPNPGLVIFGAT
jgi:hypothetical protein